SFTAHHLPPRGEYVENIRLRNLSYTTSDSAWSRISAHVVTACANRPVVVNSTIAVGGPGSAVGFFEARGE
ncbi:MAG: hypothetical protein WBV41_14335, partial [Terriglobales bacterium]